jgi:hypothetical protein
MNCIKCNAPLKEGQKKLCTRCDNLRDAAVKTGIKYGLTMAIGTFLGIIGFRKFSNNKKL